MASAFSITTATNSVPIGTQRSATVTFTVTNRSAQPLTGPAVLIMDQPHESHSDRLGLQSRQKSERYFEVNGVENYIVEVNVPVEAPAGDYLFHLDMEDTEDPDETYTVGPTVKLQVAAPEKKKKPFPWRIIAVAVGLLALIIGAIIFWPRGIKVPSVIGQPENEARATVTAAGLAFQLTAEIHNETPVGVVLATTPQAGERVGKATPVFYVRSLGSGKIAFDTSRDGNHEIYVMNADGISQIRLTNNNTEDYGPAWSPDGSKIAFYSDRDGNGEIYVMNADGTSQIRLTHNNEEDIMPAW